jgi:hypothetical protein
MRNKISRLAGVNGLNKIMWGCSCTIDQQSHGDEKNTSESIPTKSEGSESYFARQAKAFASLCDCSLGATCPKMKRVANQMF